jgi:predicted nucleic acid-binding protein
MIYVDTSCLVKLYYPEPESARVAELVSGQVLVFLSLHDLEISNALELKLFRGEARPAQVRKVAALIEEDIRTGVFHRPPVMWEEVWSSAKLFAKAHSRTGGCRSLDILHCAAAKHLSVTTFVSSDDRQRRLAKAIGLACPKV